MIIQFIMPLFMIYDFESYFINISRNDSWPRILYFIFLNLHPPSFTKFRID